MAFNKNRLQEAMAKQYLPLPEYNSMAQSVNGGFEERVQVRLPGDGILSTNGHGPTNRAAQDNAAHHMLAHPQFAAFAAAAGQSMFKNRLQEVIMRPGSPWSKDGPIYTSVPNVGPGFTERVCIRMAATGDTLEESGRGTRKKDAQQDAARLMLARIED